MSWDGKYWNYRLLHTYHAIGKLEVESFAIHEVHYDDSDRIVAWTAEPTYNAADTVDEIRKDFALMQEAFDLPVLEERELLAEMQRRRTEAAGGQVDAQAMRILTERAAPSAREEEA